MIDLELTDEHEALVATVSEWGRKEVLPQIHDLDREHRFNPDFLRQMAEAAAARHLHPRGVGGRGHGLRRASASPARSSSTWTRTCA